MNDIEKNYIIIYFISDQYEASKIRELLLQHGIESFLRHEYRLNEETNYAFTDEEAELLVERDQALKANRILIREGYKKDYDRTEVEFGLISFIARITNDWYILKIMTIPQRIGTLGFGLLIFVFVVVVYNIGYISTKEFGEREWCIESVSRHGDEDELRNRVKGVECKDQLRVNRDRLIIGYEGSGLHRKITNNEIELLYVTGKYQEISGRYKLRSMWWRRMKLEGPRIIILRHRDNS